MTAALHVTDDLSWHRGCKINGRSHLVRAASVSAAFLILPAALAWMLLAPSTVTSSQPIAPRPKIVAPADPGARPLDLQDSDGIVDLYGNEVSAAVAKYRMDIAGSLYELHSPHTELPKLASPRT